MKTHNLLELSNKNVYKEIMKRPSMYTGRNRLDYVEKFVSGFILHRLLMIPQTETVSKQTSEMYSEIQYWVMLNQSACIRGNASVNTWSLFYKCYGVKDFAISNFTKYLYADIVPQFTKKSVYPEDNCVAHDINEQFYDFKHNTSISIETLRGKITSIITEMIIGSGHKHDSIKIYVWRDDFFCQVRFVYLCQDEWREDNELINNDINYARLVDLHAAIECIESDNFKLFNNHDDSVYFHLDDESSQCKNSRYNSLKSEIYDEDSLHYRYQQWKKQF